MIHSSLSSRLIPKWLDKPQRRILFLQILSSLALRIDKTLIIISFNFVMKKLLIIPKLREINIESFCKTGTPRSLEKRFYCSSRISSKRFSHLIKRATIMWSWSSWTLGLSFTRKCCSAFYLSIMWEKYVSMTFFNFSKVSNSATVTTFTNSLWPRTLCQEISKMLMMTLMRSFLKLLHQTWNKLQELSYWEKGFWASRIVTAQKVTLRIFQGSNTHHRNYSRRT